jgi:hypothetical protein
MDNVFSDAKEGLNSPSFKTAEIQEKLQAQFDNQTKRGHGKNFSLEHDIAMVAEMLESELREQLIACYEDWQRVCDALGSVNEHMDPDDVVARIALLTEAHSRPETGRGSRRKRSGSKGRRVAGKAQSGNKDTKDWN